MSYYSKLIATIVGLAVLLLSKYGIDLTGKEDIFVDAIITALTAYSVWKLRNKPSTETQRAQALQTAQEASKDET